MRIVLRPRHALHLSRRHQFTHQNIAPSLYPLPTVVGELHLLLVELDAVAKDAEHGTRTHDIVVKAFSFSVLYCAKPVSSTKYIAFSIE